MKLLNRLSNLEKVFCLSILFISIATTPYFSYDPINLPRFVLLAIFGFMLLLILIFQKSDFIREQSKPFLFLSTCFVVWAFVCALVSQSSFTDLFFGIPGRFSGFLTYLCLFLFMGFALFLSSPELNLQLIKMLSVAGVLSALYGFIQYKDLDPFGWINEYSPVFGFFGNPNFQASFLGISATASLSLAFDKKYRFPHKFFWGIYLVFVLFIISKSKSQQGFLVFAVGVSVVLYIWLRSITNKKYSHLYLMIWIIGVVTVVIDILQKSPWAPLLYKDSVSYRGDFWRAGWAMTLDNPFFGLGIGAFGDYYREYRDQISVDRVEISANVDSAHNILLDLSSGGGFPLLMLYIGLNFITLLSALRYLKKIENFDYVFAGIFGCWMAYTAQSLISINQIGISIWGWVFSGSILGYAIDKKRTLKSTNTIKEVKIFIPVSFGLFLGIIITFPFFMSDLRFRSSVVGGDVSKIVHSLEAWPRSVEKMNFTTALFRQAGFNEQSLSIARQAVLLNPRSYEAWEQLYLSPNKSEIEETRALLKMKELDPLNQKYRA